MASEVGTISIDPKLVKSKGRLQPGKILLVDMNQGRLIPDEEIKQEFSTNRPYGKWLKNNKIYIDDLPDFPNSESLHQDNLIQRMQVFGYTSETVGYALGFDSITDDGSVIGFSLSSSETDVTGKGKR